MVILSGCSIYRSDGRKQFETAYGDKPATTFALMSCKTQGKLQSWFQEEFPLSNFELVISEPDLEIWKTTLSDHVEVRAFQRTDGGSTQACIYTFSSETSWNMYKDAFIKELENNLLTQE